MSLLSQINVITHHVLGIASYNQKEKKKKKKAEQREDLAGQCEWFKKGKKKRKHGEKSHFIGSGKT